jgi:methylmalonyl-CoA/ethylmalonyl-CoA epimerase
MEHIGAMLGGRLFQIGIVVADLDAGLRRSADIVGEQRWRCYDFGQVGRHEYHGRATTCSLRLALNDASPQMELIQPLEGDSIHRDWLAERGEGLHHIGFVVPSVERAITAMAALGIAVIQSGTGFGAAGDGDGAYAYFDSASSFGVITEAVEPPSSLPAPTIWP